MLGTRYEEYGFEEKGIHFRLAFDIKRTSQVYSKEKNWHEDPEIQFCTEGGGLVLLDGEKYEFSEGDAVIINSNVIHYTSAEESIKYDCIIVSADYCRKMGIDFAKLDFKPIVNDEEIRLIFEKMREISNKKTALRTAKLNQAILQLLILITEKYSVEKTDDNFKNKKFENIKSAIKYIRENHNKKLTLDEIAKNVFMDKFTLCREFKKITSQTVVENINRYRCLKASEFLSEGNTVAETAELCGFENLSFFTKTFKRYMGAMPSQYKNRNPF